MIDIAALVLGWQPRRPIERRGEIYSAKRAGDQVQVHRLRRGVIGRLGGRGHRLLRILPYATISLPGGVQLYTAPWRAKGLKRSGLLRDTVSGLSTLAGSGRPKWPPEPRCAHMDNVLCGAM